jgi:SPOR domain
MKKILVALSLFIVFKSNAQDTAWKKTVDSNSITVHKDPRIDLLVKKQAQINEETTRDARKTGKGFRLLVINTTKRDDAIAAKAKVYTNFPELKAYLLYQSPYYKLKVGNFKERKEAEDYQKKMKRYFPSGVFIMNDVIETKPEKEKLEEI